MPYQYLAVLRKDGTYRRVALVEYREKGKPFIVERSPDILAPIIPVSEMEFRRLMRSLPDERRQAASNRERNAAYRGALRERRPDRTERSIPDDIKRDIDERLKRNETGVAISLATGVSTSWISARKMHLKREGIL